MFLTVTADLRSDLTVRHGSTAAITMTYVHPVFSWIRTTDLIRPHFNIPRNEPKHEFTQS